MKTYRGYRVPALHSCLVTVQEDGKLARPLPPRNEVYNHSPDGFEWGYSGSGPTQLALAICCDALGDTALAQRVHLAFTSRVVAELPRFCDGW